MSLKVNQYAEVYKRVQNTSFEQIFKLLENHTDKTLFYRGISDKELNYLSQVELKLGYKLPKDYLNLLKISNGNTIFDFNFLSVTNPEDERGLFHLNFKSPFKNNYQVPQGELVIAKSDNLFVTLGLDDESYAYYNIYEKSSKKRFLTTNEVTHIIYYEISFHLFNKEV